MRTSACVAAVLLLVSAAPVDAMAQSTGDWSSPDPPTGDWSNPGSYGDNPLKETHQFLEDTGTGFFKDPPLDTLKKTIWDRTKKTFGWLDRLFDWMNKRTIVKVFNHWKDRVDGITKIFDIWKAASKDFDRELSHINSYLDNLFNDYGASPIIHDTSSLFSSTSGNTSTSTWKHRKSLLVKHRRSILAALTAAGDKFTLMTSALKRMWSAADAKDQREYEKAKAEEAARQAKQRKEITDAAAAILSSGSGQGSGVYTVYWFHYKADGKTCSLWAKGQNAMEHNFKICQNGRLPGGSSDCRKRGWPARFAGMKAACLGAKRRMRNVDTCRRSKDLLRTLEKNCP